MEISRKGDWFSLTFSREEAEKLGFSHKREYELAKARDGIWVMTEGAEISGTPKTDETEQHIIGLLKKSSLSERVEGAFEKKLSSEELGKLREMLSRKKVEKFRLNESYKKAVYQLPEKPQVEFENIEKPFHDYTLQKDGFVVVKNELNAKVLSEQLKDSIKDGRIKGTRSFTGEFYIIKSSLLEIAEEKVLGELRGKPRENIDELSRATGLTPTLCKIAVEFLKEDGQIIEKRKEQYQYIE